MTGDNENNNEVHMLLETNDVLVMTPKILENHLEKKYLPHLGVFSMIIFDEAHHARKGEPYNSLMLSYLKTKKENESSANKLIALPQVNTDKSFFFVKYFLLIRNYIIMSDYLLRYSFFDCVKICERIY